MTEEATAPEEIPSEDETSLPESAEQSETQETEVEEPEAEAEKPKKTAKDRIDELTRARREAERDAEYWRSKALQQPEPQAPAAQQAPSNERPSPDSFDAGEFDTRYIEALADWKANQVVDARLQQLEQRGQQQTVEKEWRSRVERVAETLPDFEERVVQGAQRNEWACTPLTGEVLRSAEKGPEIAYHLASNPTEAARIYRLPPALQIMELGKIEASLSAPKSKTATTAPVPVPQVRGSGGKFATPADTNDFAAFEKQYGGS